jgi:hypothetical protein
MTGVFNHKKPQIPHPPFARTGDATPFLHVFNPPIPALIPETGALEVYRFYFKLLQRFFLNRYSSWQVNNLSAYSAIFPQATRTVVCFLGDV